jgi:hypothetical protein
MFVEVADPGFAAAIEAVPGNARSAAGISMVIWVELTKFVVR